MNYSKYLNYNLNLKSTFKVSLSKSDFTDQVVENVLKNLKIKQKPQMKILEIGEISITTPVLN